MPQGRRAGALPALLCFVFAACTKSSLPTATPASNATSAPSSGSPSTRPGAVATPGAGGTAGPIDVSTLSVTLKPFTKIDGSPLAIAAPEDGSGRLFVVSQDGRIWVVAADGTVKPDPMVDLRDFLVSGGEQGLLGLALHPGFPKDPRVYVDYTTGTQDVISTLSLDRTDPDKLDRTTLKRILAVDDPFPNHNGGDLLFGPDGYLYAFMGDGGSGGDPLGNGQDRKALLGKVLRLDIDHPSGDVPYSAPPGNPFNGAGGRDEIWLLGMRNPWRNSFDRKTGDLWIGDVGQSAWEEVDVARAGVGGLNFGWNVMEGNHCYSPSTNCSTDGLTRPVTEYGHDLGCTVVGGYVYRGITYPRLAGVYLFADYCSGRIFALDPSTDAFRDPIEVGNADGNLSSFGEDTAGELYITHLNGDVSRVVASSR
jgi:glucose/arabinose dehydrogenase